jgi:hypothetical protein
MSPNADTETLAILGGASVVAIVYVATRYGVVWTMELSPIVLSIFLSLILVKERRWLGLKLLRMRSMAISGGLDRSKILPEQLLLRRSGVAILKRGNRVNLISGVKVSGNPSTILMGDLDYQRSRTAGSDYLSIFMRYRDLFVSLRRLSIPVRYVVLLSPLDSDSRRSKDRIKSLAREFIESDEDKGEAVTWGERDQLARKLSQARTFGFVKLSQFLLLELKGSVADLETLEERVILSAEKTLLAVSTAFPELTVERASPADALEALYSLYWDEGPEGQVLLPHEATRVMNFSTPLCEGAGDPFALFPAEPPADVTSHELHLGWVEYLGRRLGHFTLCSEDLTKHVTILGSTGSGKSTTAKRLIEECIRIGLPVLIFDWHNEYRNFIKACDGEVYAPGLEDSPFTISPLESFSTRDLAEHMALITDIFVENYSLTHPQAFMLREAIREVLGTRTLLPNANASHSLNELVEAIEVMPPRSYYDNETKMALLRRLKPLTEGQAGRALGGKGSVNVPDILGKTIVIELGHFRESETRRIFSSFILKMIYDYRVAMGESKLRHVCIIEEASNIVPFKDMKTPPSIGEKMVSELRKFGEGIVVISQFPSQISQGILKNSGTRICHRMGGVEEERIIRDLIGLNEAQFAHIKYLAPGRAVVYLSNLANPFLISIESPRQQIKADVPSS